MTTKTQPQRLWHCHAEVIGFATLVQVFFKRFHSSDVPQ